jgi:hypothetical protein
MPMVRYAKLSLCAANSAPLVVGYGLHEAQIEATDEHPFACKFDTGGRLALRD